ncbi:MAG: alpha/beta fold hydrolase [Cyclobacteriaceae bacterium]|nr:alpha/beta fold hydrolase [Cyclobacteriaceae bacterium]
MALIENSSYKKPFYYWNGHWETIVPSMFRKIDGVTYQRERLELPDGDFVDLDELKQDSSKLVIITHGLEGNSNRHYAKGMAKYFFQNGWDAIAWNCRGCSGHTNRLPRFYHHGATEDLAAVVQHALDRKRYKTIVLIGFSMGGSMTLKYLGERGIEVDPTLKTAVVFSVPCDLGASASELDKTSRKFYLNRFLKKLSVKIKAKSQRFPKMIDAEGFDQIKSFREFDNRYTAPLHGFKNADDFYEKASCGPYLIHIKKPVLIVNSWSDPFLPLACFPIDIAKSHEYVHLETPKHGGHTAFSLIGKKENWMELRALEFISQIIE